MKQIAVYLDNCCFNRPYDDQTQVKVNLEAQAKMYVQKLIVEKKLDFVYSYMSIFENEENPFISRRNTIADFFGKAVRYVHEDWKDIADEKASEIMKTGIKEKDAIHIACAIFGKADYFLTTDIRLLKFETDEIVLMNPVDFVRELEELL